MILAASGGYDIDNNHLYIVLQRNKKTARILAASFFFTLWGLSLYAVVV